jgi:hypothetical protein
VRTFKEKADPSLRSGYGGADFAGKPAAAGKLKMKSDFYAVADFVRVFGMQLLRR